MFPSFHRASNNFVILFFPPSFFALIAYFSRYGKNMLNQKKRILQATRNGPNQKKHPVHNNESNTCYKGRPRNMRRIVERPKNIRQCPKSMVPVFAPILIVHTN